MSTDRLTEAVDRGLGAFWDVIVRAYPEAKMGDISPSTLDRFEASARNAVQAWVHTNAMRPMTLEEFRATGQDVGGPEFARRVGYDDSKVGGRIYICETHIERMPAIAGVVVVGQEWCCTIANDSRAGSLAEMEEFLFEWALDECDLRVPIGGAS